MKYYILNTKTDKHFDTVENKFYGSNWNPIYTDDVAELESLIEADPIKFADCEIVEVEDCVHCDNTGYISEMRCTKSGSSAGECCGGCIDEIPCTYCNN